MKDITLTTTHKSIHKDLSRHFNVDESISSEEIFKIAISANLTLTDLKNFKLRWFYLDCEYKSLLNMVKVAESLDNANKYLERYHRELATAKKYFDEYNTDNGNKS